MVLASRFVFVNGLVCVFMASGFVFVTGFFGNGLWKSCSLCKSFLCVFLDVLSDGFLSFLKDILVDQKGNPD